MTAQDATTKTAPTNRQRRKLAPSLYTVVVLILGVLVAGLLIAVLVHWFTGVDIVKAKLLTDYDISVTSDQASDLLSEETVSVQIEGKTAEIRIDGHSRDFRVVQLDLVEVRR